MDIKPGEITDILKRERLSASLAKRPNIDLLQQRNILPDAQRQASAAQKPHRR